MNLLIKFPFILFLVLSFIFFSPLAQTSNPTSESAAAFYKEGNMMKANMQYAALLSVEPKNTDYQYYYAVTCTVDSALREEGIDRLKSIDNTDLFGGERLFFLALAYHHSADYARAIQFFKQALENAVAKPVWLAEATFRLAQCEAVIETQTSVAHFTRLSSMTVLLQDFFRSIPTNKTPYRMILLPAELRTKYDKRKGWVSPVAFDAEADLIYFSSYGKKGETGLDIYSAKVLNDGSIDLPVRLPESVNSLADEINPCFHSGSSTLIFASNRVCSLGGYDIFSSEVIASSGTYLDCSVFQNGINSPLNEFGYYPFDNINGGWLVSDKTGYFSEIILSEIKLEITASIELPMEEVIEESELIEEFIEVAEPDDITSSIESEQQLRPVQPILESEYNLSIQIGVFSNEPDVSQLPFGFDLFTLILPSGLYKVYSGPYENTEVRDVNKQKLIQLGFTDVFNVVAKP
jgi:hypothetical protein